MIFLSFLSIIYSATIAKSNSIKNCSNCSGFGKKLGNVKPNDPFFYPTAFVLKCKNKKDDRLSGYLNSNYLWASQKGGNGVRIAIGYKDENKKFNLDIIHRSFKYRKTSYYHFKTESKDNITFLDEVSKGLEGNRFYKNEKKESCIFQINKTFYQNLKNSIINPYTGNSVKEKKKALNRAINALKGFDSRQYDINQYLTKNGETIDIKFELSDLMTDLTVKMVKLDMSPKIIIKEDEESKRLVEQKSKELEQEKLVELQKKKNVKF